MPLAGNGSLLLAEGVLVELQMESTSETFRIGFNGNDLSSILSTRKASPTEDSATADTEVYDRIWIPQKNGGPAEKSVTTLEKMASVKVGFYGRNER